MVYTYFRNWRNDGTWLMIHDRFYGRVRADNDSPLRPSEAIVDSQSLATDKMVSEAVGYDAGKKAKGRKRHTMLDTQGLVLQVIVTAPSTLTGKAASKYCNSSTRCSIRISPGCTGSGLTAVSVARRSLKWPQSLGSFEGQFNL